MTEVRGGSCVVQMETSRCEGCTGRCAIRLGVLGALELPSCADLRVGHKVHVGVSRLGFSLAAAIVFGTPLLSMLLAWFIAASLEVADGLAAIPALIGLMLGGILAIRMGKNGALQRNM